MGGNVRDVIRSADALRGAGRIQEAITLLEESVVSAESPDASDRYQYVIGDFLYMEGRWNEAIAAYRKIWRRRASAHAGNAQLEVARCYYAQGDIGRALAAVRELKRKLPEDPASIVGLEFAAVILAEAGDNVRVKRFLNSCRPTIRRALRSPNEKRQVLARWFQANRYEDAGRPGAAAKCLDSILRACQAVGLSPAMDWFEERIRELERDRGRKRSN